MFRRMSGSLALLIALMFSATAQAQDRYLSQIYGQGVHSFHRGNTAQATQQFTSAIDMGMNDPRPYYFRAIANLRSGNGYSAESDIRQGATLEVNGSGSYSIGRALERIQGPARLRFENLRRSALLQATRDRAAMQRLNTESRGNENLMGPPATPALIPPAEGDNPFADDNADENDDALEMDEPEPFGNDDLLDEPAGDEMSEDPPAEDADEDDLFGNDDSASDGAAEDDLFGDDTGTDDGAGDGLDDAGDDTNPFNDEPTGDDSLDAGEEDDLFGGLDDDDSVADAEVTGDDSEEAAVSAVNLDDLFGN